MADTVTLVLMSSAKGLHKIMKAQFRDVPVLARERLQNYSKDLHEIIQQTIRPT